MEYSIQHGKWGGYYVLFLKGNDRLLASSLMTSYIPFFYFMPDILHFVTLLKKNETGLVKYSPQYDARFQNDTKRTILSKNGQEAVEYLLNKQINRFLGTKVYNRAFLVDKGIKFDEHLSDDEAELFFQIECFLKSNHFMYRSEFAYIAPKNLLDKYSFTQSSVNDNSIVPKQSRNDNINAQIVSKFSRYFTARIDISLVPKTEGGDFQILAVSDDRATIGEQFWLPKGCIGYVLQSYAGNLEFIVKPQVDGRVNLNLLGIDVRTPGDSSKFIPHWIDYTRLFVNYKRIIVPSRTTPVWHNKPYRYSMEVKAGDEIIIDVDWIPHRGDT